jgi:hypothetical protein
MGEIEAYVFNSSKRFALFPPAAKLGPVPAQGAGSHFDLNPLVALSSPRHAQVDAGQRSDGVFAPAWPLQNRS